jgi:hypothetical protein
MLYTLIIEPGKVIKKLIIPSSPPHSAIKFYVDVNMSLTGLKETLVNLYSFEALKGDFDGGICILQR